MPQLRRRWRNAAPSPERPTGEAERAERRRRGGNAFYGRRKGKVCAGPAAAARDAAAAPAPARSRAARARGAVRTASRPGAGLARDRLRRRRASRRRRRAPSRRPASSAASPSSTAWRSSWRRSSARACRTSASRTATRPRCCRASPRRRSIASTCSIPIPGRSGATASAASLSDETLAAFARVLRPGGELRFATDIDDYAGWALGPGAALARLSPGPPSAPTTGAALARLARHPLRGQGRGRGPAAELPDLPADVTAAFRRIRFI